MDILCTRLIKNFCLNEAAEVGINIQCKSFIEIVPVLSLRLRNNMEPYLKHPALTFLFTSKHAVDISCQYYFKSIPNNIRNTWRFFCLSGATKNALLRYFNAEQIIAAAPDARQLSNCIMAAFNRQKPIHFVCGNRRRTTLPDFMQEHNQPYKEWIVYQTICIPRRLNRDYDGYIFCSPSAVESFFSLNVIQKDRPCFVIGKTTGNAIAGVVTNPVIRSAYPSSEGIIKEVFKYYHIRK